MGDIRVRYAPSPTGHLHIGNARTALFNYLFARSQNGKFIIRIEDTDQKRNVEGGEASQLKYLNWLGIDWDESVDVGGEYGPYRQSERLDIYKKYTNELLEKGFAYKCYCTEDELEQERQKQIARGVAPHYSGKCRHLTAEDRERLEREGKKPVIRFKVPEGKTYSFRDMVKGDVIFESKDISDFVIVKNNGWPLYNFAVVIDDYLMKITHVLRGDDHISNTPKQLMIYEAFGWEPPKFGHMTLIVNEQHKKLSKRDESIIQFIEQYEELGYLPEALFNFIALLGWSPVGEEEIFSREELINIFDPKRLSKSPAVFDKKKLAWMNNQYVKKLNKDQVYELALPHLKNAGRVSEQLTPEEEEFARTLVSLYQEQMSYGAEIIPLSDLFFKEEIHFDEESKQVLQGEHVHVVLEAFLNEVEGLENFAAAEIMAAIKHVQKATGIKGKKLYMPIRVAATGQQHGPAIGETLELLGKEKTIKRLRGLLN